MHAVLKLVSAARNNDHEAGLALLHKKTGLPFEAANAESDGKPVLFRSPPRSLPFAPADDCGAGSFAGT
jgi:hypothetical protein